MSIYKQDFEYLGLQLGQYTFKGEIKLEEVPMYGSSRLGVYEKEENLASIEFNTDDEYLEGGYFKLKQYDYSSWVVNPYRNWKTREINFTNFELSNHLGNVLAMVTDYKIGIDSIYTYSPGNNGTRKYKNHAFTMQSSGQYTVSLPANPFTVNAYHANIRNATDYYPFGMMIPWRYDDGDDGNFNTSLDIPMNLGEHRFGFNGQEKDDEIKGTGNSLDFGARIYDSRIGRFLSIDPWTKKYPWQTIYAYNRNSPVKYIDWKGFGDPLKTMKIRNNQASNLMGGAIRTNATTAHQGFDYEAEVGTDVFATGPGKVVTVGYSNTYGNYVVLETLNEENIVRYVLFAHLETVSVDEDTWIGEDETIGTVGISGNADAASPHLHMEVWKASNPGCSMTNRVSPNEVTDTDFYTQNNNANQTLTGVKKVEYKEGGITITNQNRNGTEDVVREPIEIEKLERKASSSISVTD